ncbi:MAG TPA: hypothetical protein VGV85_00650 [Longimicrobiaceae bacterium]|nr:hypothetical protein [Longimicrobiaceae bacterium]
MRIARRAATLALVLAAAACGTATPTGPEHADGTRPDQGVRATPGTAGPRFGNGMMGSGA